VGLFRSIGRIAQKIVAPAMAAGHIFTSPIARFAPGVLGLKSESSRAIVNVTQGALLAGGTAALGVRAAIPRDRAGNPITMGGQGFQSAQSLPMADPSYDPREAQVEQFIRSLLEHHVGRV
jgi:hypothetical protein